MSVTAAGTNAIVVCEPFLFICLNILLYGILMTFYLMSVNWLYLKIYLSQITLYLKISLFQTSIYL